MSDTTAPTAAAPPPRLASLDAYRGFTMLALALTAAQGGWQEPIAEAHEWFRPLADQFEHVVWRGLTLWDLIQPSFMFMVGVAVPYSYASRKKRGATGGALAAHAAWRALLLILLGVFLRSVGREQTYWTFEDVVTQIGLGYLPLFWLATRTQRTQVIAAASLLLATWLAFAFWPRAWDGPGVVEHFAGFWAAWNENAGPGAALDRWLLNLFPRPEPFVINDGGYYTLNFVPSLATMTLGLLAGQKLRSEETPQAMLVWLFGWGAALAALGLVLDLTGVCPLVKKNWTPTFGVVSGGACLGVLGAFYGVIDLAGCRQWSWPAQVVGRNPLAVYIMTWTLAGWLLANLTTHLGEKPFAMLGEPYSLLLQNLAVGGLVWLIAWWMDRNRVYVRL